MCLLFKKKSPKKFTIFKKKFMWCNQHAKPCRARSNVSSLLKYHII